MSQLRLLGQAVHGPKEEVSVYSWGNTQLPARRYFQEVHKLWTSEHQGILMLPIHRDQFWDIVRRRSLPTWGGLAKSLIGMGLKSGGELLLVYSYTRAISELTGSFSTSRALKDAERVVHAINYFDTDIRPYWVGEKTPCFLKQVESI